ncbi:MAG: hypothetical protein AVDCRST_MAG79-2713 [uncultured Thermoleophilia bacterium]|uniref:Uncharacterized protein n=1 Tax=uncultured Thermoleophilia bacterium TaxID=1497501 RepID=A0A6J4UHT2_9ACTN|nr:MAG: hypothetical protein AVDCRST_MAG79-2713 [uncultured Thermoleophilia bacterium]
MRRPPDLAAREREAIAALSRGLGDLDDETRGALRDALGRDDLQLTGGDWGCRDDGEGCLLSLAAWQLGLPGGDALLPRSIAAVRLPVLFDQAWALILQRTGNAEEADRTVRRLLEVALDELDERGTRTEAWEADFPPADAERLAVLRA